MTYIPQAAIEAMAKLDGPLQARLEARAVRMDNEAERRAIDGLCASVMDCGAKPGPVQIELVDRMLSGSQAKTAFALRMNCERMVREDGLNSIGFLTLTVGEKDETGTFQKVPDGAEASRRLNNLNRRVLKNLFERAVIVTERHKSGEIHFHILGTLRGRPDIRSGLNFAAVKARDYRSASPALRALWKNLREILPDYGFGRHELMPVEKTGEAVSSYVSKYIEKNVCNRLKSDHRKKLVRYLGWEKKQLKPNEFSWGSHRACAWRQKARKLAGLVGIETREQAAECLGPRWAWNLTTLWKRVFGDDLIWGFKWDFSSREVAKAEIANLNLAWCRKKEAEKYRFSEEFREMKAIWRTIYCEEHPAENGSLCEPEYWATLST